MGQVATLEGEAVVTAGQEVLTMAVVSPIPSYTSNSFKLPKGVCIEFKSMFARFWWSQMGNERRDY